MKDGTNGTLDRCGWQAALAAPGTGAVAEPVGAHHAAVRAEDGPVLLVTFERAEDIPAARADGQPLAATLAEPAGWSRLTLVARGETWFRDPAVYAYVDRLTDEGYFDGFDRVLFYGAEMGAHAAAAYSVAAPGAVVVALSPRATLDPALAGWDARARGARRLDFTSRYGFAPHMIEAADRAMVIYDPERPADAAHAALFHGAHVMRVRAPFCGEGIEAHLMAMGILPEVLDAAGEGRLCERVFHRLFRARRSYGPYLRSLLDRLEQEDRPALAARVCRQVLRERDRPSFARRLAALEARLAGQANPCPVPCTAS